MRMRRGIVLVVVTLVGGGSLLAGSTSFLAASQDRLVIDPDGGRRIIGGFEYEFLGEGGKAIDHRRGWLYDSESADPHRVQAISLETGEVIHTYGSGEGDGPGELREIRDIAAASDGLIVASRNRVSRWDATGRFLGTWIPSGSAVEVCLLGGEPAVPVPGGIGVAYRTSDGSTATIPAGISPFGVPAPEGAWSYARFDLRVACDDRVAYVAADNRITGFPTDGDPFDVPIPKPFGDDAAVAHARATPGERYFPWYDSMSLDARGRIVLISALGATKFAGVLIEPNTGCHSFIVDDAPGASWRGLMGTYRDSALVAEWRRVEVEREGETLVGRDVSFATGIWLMPLVADPESAALRAEAGCGEAG